MHRVFSCSCRSTNADRKQQPATSPLVAASIITASLPASPQLLVGGYTVLMSPCARLGGTVWTLSSARSLSQPLSQPPTECSEHKAPPPPPTIVYWCTSHCILSYSLPTTNSPSVVLTLSLHSHLSCILTCAQKLRSLL